MPPKKSCFRPPRKVTQDVFHKDILGHGHYSKTFCKEVTIEIFFFFSPRKSSSHFRSLAYNYDCRRKTDCTCISSLSPVLLLLSGLDDVLTEQFPLGK